MRAALFLLPLALCAACLRTTEFRCSLDNQCNPGGACQSAVGYCSFSDSGCPSGQRFGDSAGDYANKCVGEQSGGVDAAIDGPPIDSPPTATCPATYAALAGGPVGHVYLKAPTSQNWMAQFNFCKSSSTRAYLAVPDDALELTGLHTLAGGTFWVGLDDQVTEGTFILASGGTSVPPTLWLTGQPDNGGGGAVENCVAATATTLSDERCSGGGGANKPAVCECVP